MNDKNWTIYKADFVDILQNSGNIYQPFINRNSMREGSKSDLPCKCQTKMFSLLDIVLWVQIKWDCAEPQLASLVIVKQDRWLDHFQRIGHTKLYPHLAHYIFPWGSYMLLQCLHMYYTQRAVQWKNKMSIKICLHRRLALVILRWSSKRNTFPVDLP
jgi:hypothetical protein